MAIHLSYQFILSRNLFVQALAQQHSSLKSRNWQLPTTTHSLSHTSATTIVNSPPMHTYIVNGKYRQTTRRSARDVINFTVLVSVSTPNTCWSELELATASSLFTQISDVGNNRQPSLSGHTIFTRVAHGHTPNTIDERYIRC